MLSLSITSWSTCNIILPSSQVWLVLVCYCNHIKFFKVTESGKENLGSSPMQWNSPSMTPPPSFTSIRTPIKNNQKNPFDANLTEHLHLETFSPSVFSRVLSPSEDQESQWRIEHVALLNPTDFSPNFNTHLTDPTTEAEAQEKILQFFSQKQIAPSPWSHPRTRVLARSKSKMPGDSSPVQTVSRSGEYAFCCKFFT